MKVIAWSTPESVTVTDTQTCIIDSTDALLLITNSDERTGGDLQGTVIDVGCDVATFEPGDRVLAPCLRADRGFSALAGYTEYLSSTGMRLARVPLAEYNLLPIRDSA
jgi:threonine dehydrogenase-like Zn-dependent dehydrogenase